MNSEISGAIAGPPVLVTLATGLMIAFAVQLLLTVLGVAIGMTVLSLRPKRSTDAPEIERAGSNWAGKIGFAIGLGVLLTVNLVLFVACFMAVKLSVVGNMLLGAILGVVIWSGYCLILTWISSKLLGSLFGTIASTLTIGVQGFLSMVMSAFGRKSSDRDEPEESIHNRLEATESNLRLLQHQVESGQQTRLEEQVQAYLQNWQPPQPDLAAIRQEFAQALSDLQEQPIDTQALDRQALVELVSSRTDFSPQDVQQIVEQLEAVWQEILAPTTAVTNLTTFLRTAAPTELTVTELNQRLQQLRSPASEQFNELSDSRSLRQQLVQTVRQRLDLSDLEVGRILQQLQAWISSAATSESELDFAFEPIRADVEAFLLNAHPWQFSSEQLPTEFQVVIYDPEANPIAVYRQLLPLDPEWLRSWLNQREDLTSTQIDQVVDRLETIRQKVLQTLQAAIAQEQIHTFVTRMIDHCRTAKNRH